MWNKIIEADTLQRVGGVAAAVVTWWQPDAFFYLTVLLAASNALDWIFGRHAHQKVGDFCPTASREGLVRKAAQLSILLILRTLEAILPMLTLLPSTKGVVSSGIALLLVIEDLESIERHLITLGGRPVPGLSIFLKRLRVVTGGGRQPDPPANSTPKGA